MTTNATSEYLSVKEAAAELGVSPSTIWRWIEAGRQLSEQGFQIVISAGPDEEEVEAAEQIREAIGRETLSTAGQLSWTKLAWLLYRASLFVGVDTAAMHLAAACQTPTVALFGESIASYWHPWKVRHRLVRPHDFLSVDELARLAPEELLINLPVSQVVSACSEMLQR